jgi:hypothetical protein
MYIKTSTLWIGIAILTIIVIGFLSAFALKVQHDVVNPQIRQNLIDDPATTIANRRDFHEKLAEIIDADQNVLTDLDALTRCTATTCDMTTMNNNLIGVEQIRADAINAYNAQADNPDVNKDMEKWMPKHIDATSIPANTGQATQFLQNEIDTLQSIYNKGI